MRTEYAGKVCVEFDMWAAFSRGFAKTVLMFGCCGSHFSAGFYCVGYLRYIHILMCKNDLLLH